MSRVLIGYRLRDMEGTFHDRVNGIHLSGNEVLPLEEKAKIKPDSLTSRWIQCGGLIPVYEDESIPPVPKREKVVRSKKK